MPQGWGNTHFAVRSEEVSVKALIFKRERKNLERRVAVCFFKVDLGMLSRALCEATGTATSRQSNTAHWLKLEFRANLQLLLFFKDRYQML